MLKKLSVFLFCAVVLLVSQVFASTDLVSVVISGETYLSGSQAALKDVAVIKGGDSYTRKALEDIVVCRIPMPGQYVRVSKATLMSRIRQSKVNVDRFVLETPENFRIYSSLGYVYKKDILKAAVDHLKEQNLLDSKTFPFQKDLPQRVEVPASGKVTYRCGLASGDNLAVDVTVVVDNVDAGSFKVAFVKKGGITAMKPGAGNNGLQPPGTPEINADNTPENPPSGATTVLAKSGFKVKRGDPLKVYIRRKNLIVTVDGRAEQAGSAGDVIRVSTIGGKNIVNALILDRSTAVADL